MSFGSWLADQERDPFPGEQDLELRESPAREDARGFRQRAEGGTFGVRPQREKYLVLGSH